MVNDGITYVLIQRSITYSIIQLIPSQIVQSIYSMHAFMHVALNSASLHCFIYPTYDPTHNIHTCSHVHSHMFRHVCGCVCACVHYIPLHVWDMHNQHKLYAFMHVHWSAQVDAYVIMYARAHPYINTCIYIYIYI